MEQAKPPHQRVFNEYVRLVRWTTGAAVTLGKFALRPVLGSLELPNRLQPHIVDRLQAERPLTDAKIAQEAILRGQAARDSDLVVSGEAMLVIATQKAATDEAVPVEISTEVLQIAHQVHLNPDAANVPPAIAEQVRLVLDQFNGDPS